MEEPFIEKEHRFLKFLFFVFIVGLLVGGGYYYYTNYFSKPERTINNILDEIEKKIEKKFINTNKPLEINGLLKLNLSLDEKQKNTMDLFNNLTLQFNGEYDPKQEIVNADITSKYKDDELIRIKTYMENQKIYFYSHDLYDKYLYIDTTNEKQKDNFTLDDSRILFTKIMKASNDSLDKDKFTKEDTIITINEKQKDVHKYQLLLKDKEINNLYDTIYNKLKNDSEVNNLLKKLSLNMEDLKQEEYQGTLELNFYTTNNLLQEELLRIESIYQNEETIINTIDILDEDNFLINIKTKENEVSCKLTINNSILNIDFKEKDKETSIGFTLNLNYQEVKEIEKIDIVNSKKIDDLTDEDIQIIDDNLAESDTLANFYNELMSIFTGNDEV